MVKKVQLKKKANSAPASKAIKKTPAKSPAMKNQYTKQIKMFKGMNDYFQMNQKYASK